MKKSTVITIAIALGVQLVGLLAYANLGGAASVNYVGDHKNNSSVTNTTCKGCHGDRKREASLSARWITPHKRHLISPALKIQCRTCHENTVTGNNWNSLIQAGAQQHSYEGNLSYATTDSYETNTRKARKGVAPSVCKTCHGAFPSATHGGINWAVTSPRACLTCHLDGGIADSPTTAHTYDASNSKRDSKYLLPTTDGDYIGGVNLSLIKKNKTTWCAKCHGKLAWYQVPGDY